MAVVPTFSEEALRSYESASSALGLTIDNLRLRFERADGESAGDTVITLLPGQDSVVIEAKVRLNTSPERLKARLELRLGDLVLFAGTTQILAVAGAAANAPLIAMNYVGPILPPLLPLKLP